MTAASNSSRSIVVAVILVALVLSPSVAARQQATGNSPGNAYAPLVKANQVNVKCPACICCGPPPPPTPAPSACCKCCDSHNDTHSKFGFP